MLNEQQLRTFESDGALVVGNAIEPEYITALRRAFEIRLDSLVSSAERLGVMSPLPSNAGFDEKLTALVSAAPHYYQHLDISLPMLGDLASEVSGWQQIFGDSWEKEAGFFAPDAVFNLITHPNIISIARQILGDDVDISPVQHVRIKPPQRLLSAAAAGDANMARTLWHQDEAVVTEDAKNVPILTVWLAITDANIENGCMYAVRGSHHESYSGVDFGLMRHCPGKELAGEIYIPEESIPKEDMVPLEAESGSLVLLHRRTVHGAGANKSNGIRWSFDLRYQPAGTPSGRECFPSFPLSNKSQGAEAYREQWRQARDAIIAGDIPAVFNKRWDKYAQICA